MRPRVLLGRVPSPVRRLESVSTEHVELWVKDDGALHPLYGGNKIRKLEYLLGDALRRNKKRVVSVGSASSHHVLATALFAREVGLESASVLCPHPFSEHAQQVLDAIFATGTDVATVDSMAQVPLALLRHVRRGDYVLWPGGSNVTGGLGYVDAVAELHAQVRTGLLPAPDVIVVAVGSGGTAAGLAAGVLRAGMSATVLGVCVVNGPRIASALTRSLAWAIARSEGIRVSPGGLRSRLCVTGIYRGRGYGWPTSASEKASVRAAEIGLRVDPTYTAKAFAAALDCTHGEIAAHGPVHRYVIPVLSSMLGSQRPLRVLYWHTLSSVVPESSVVSKVGAGHRAGRTVTHAGAQWGRLLIRA